MAPIDPLNLAEKRATAFPTGRATVWMSTPGSGSEWVERAFLGKPEKDTIMSTNTPNDEYVALEKFADWFFSSAEGKPTQPDSSFVAFSEVMALKLAESMGLPIYLMKSDGSVELLRDLKDPAEETPHEALLRQYREGDAHERAMAEAEIEMREDLGVKPHEPSPAARPNLLRDLLAGRVQAAYEDAAEEKSRALRDASEKRFMKAMGDRRRSQFAKEEMGDYLDGAMDTLSTLLDDLDWSGSPETPVEVSLTMGQIHTLLDVAQSVAIQLEADDPSAHDAVKDLYRLWDSIEDDRLIQHFEKFEKALDLAQAWVVRPEWALKSEFVIYVGEDNEDALAFGAHILGPESGYGLSAKPISDEMALELAGAARNIGFRKALLD